MSATGCQKCGKTKETIPADEYHEREERDVIGALCLLCLREEIAARERAGELGQAGAKILSAPQGSSFEEFRDKLLKHALKPDHHEIRTLWDAATSHPNVYKRGTTHFIRRNDEPELKAGTKLWRRVLWRRPFAHAASIMEVPPTKFVAADRSWLAFAAWGNSFGDVWEASDKGPGMACFSRVPIPDDWTALEITGFSANGRTAFVKPYVGAKDELLDAHKRKCPKCSNKIGLDARCPFCVEKELAETRAEYARLQAKASVQTYGYAPSPIVKDKPFVCRGCNKKAPKGRGKCVVCRKEYA